MSNEERAQEYLTNNGFYCPYCGSLNTDSNPVMSPGDDTGTAIADVHCLDCKKAWKDVYTLTGVQLEDSDEEL